MEHLTNIGRQHHHSGGGGGGNHGLSPQKARRILKDGEVRGHPLTAKQKRFFGAVASGESVRVGGEVGAASAAVPWRTVPDETFRGGEWVVYGYAAPAVVNEDSGVNRAAGYGVIVGEKRREPDTVAFVPVYPLAAAPWSPHTSTRYEVPRAMLEELSVIVTRAKPESHGRYAVTLMYEEPASGRESRLNKRNTFLAIGSHDGAAGQEAQWQAVAKPEVRTAIELFNKIFLANTQLS